MTTAPTSSSASSAQRLRGSFRNVLRHFVVLAAGLLIVCVAGTATAQQQPKKKGDPFVRSGFYVGMSGVYQRNVLEGTLENAIEDEINTVALGPNTIQVSNFSLDIDDSGGLNALVGYRAASFFAVEFEYEWIEEYDVDASGTGTVIVGPQLGQSINVGGNIYSIEGHLLTLNTKWIVVPVWRIQPYLTFGAGLAVYDTDRGNAAGVLETITSNDVDIEGGTHAALAGRFGAGIDWYLTENFLINTHYNVLLTTQDFKTPGEDNVDDLNYMAFSAGLQYRF